MKEYLIHIFYIIIFIILFKKLSNVEKMTDTTTLNQEHLLAIKNLGLVASSMVSGDGETLELPYKKLIVGNAIIGDSPHNGWAMFSHKDRTTKENYAFLAHVGGGTIVNSDNNSKIELKTGNSNNNGERVDIKLGKFTSPIKTDNIYLTDGNTKLQRGNNNSLRIQTNYGYLDIGAQNGNWAHIYTDREKFAFNRELWAVQTSPYKKYMDTGDVYYQTHGFRGSGGGNFTQSFLKSHISL